MKIEEIDKAVKILKKGGVVVYPTDTAYGLAVDATNLSAVKKLYAVKGRDFKKPIHIIFPNADWLKKIVRLNKNALRLMNKFLPGPLTIVLPIKAHGVSWKKLSAGTGTLGIRYPDHSVAQMLVEMFGKPITTTSANVSGLPNTYSVAEVKRQFAKSKLNPDYYLDGGKLKKIMPSTLVSVVNNNVTIIRQGPISEKQIKNALK